MFFDSILLAAGSSPNVYYAYETSDFMGKLIVIMLFAGSVFTWTIMLERGVMLYKAKKASEKFIADFRDKKYPLAVYHKSKKDFSPVARVYDNGAERLLDFYEINPEIAEHYGTPRCPAKKLTTPEIEAVRTVLERTVSDQILKLEDKMGFLATAVSVSPFIGLFGTVWGVMIAFIALAIQGRPDIASLAPGVSGALLATVVGLLVAIPSLIGYNCLSIVIRKITVYMDNFVEEFMAKLKLEQFNIEE
jgi:biopolymer transport protein TolQ